MKNILFWKAVRVFQEEEYSYAAAVFIFDQFIARNSPQMININAGHRNDIIKAFDNAEMVEHDVFNEAQFEIVRLMAFDSLYRLKKQPEFVEYVNSRDVERAKWLSLVELLNWDQ